MSLAIFFWVLMVLWAVLGLWSSWPNLRAGAPTLVLFLVIASLGWKVFGPPING